MKKILSLLMLVFLSDFAFAGEQSGMIMGVHLAKGFAKAERSDKKAPTHSGYRYGLMLGYKEFASPELGVRYYGVFDFGSKYSNDEKTEENGGYKIYTYSFNLNLDVIRDFVLNSGMHYGFYAGISAGYTDSRLQGSFEQTVAGLDFGFNAGVRMGFESVTTEIYGHFNVLEQKGKVSSTNDRVSQPYQVGLRLVYAF